MSDKRYWQSFAELNHKDEVLKRNKDEFKEDLPFEDLDGSLLDAKTPRRDFLKYVGFSTAAATLAASCEVPVRKAVPWVNRPENQTPGVAKYYASTYVQDGDVMPVVVKVREGRPIKIEGNSLYPYTQGGTSARAQASVLDLYDMHRIPHPKRKAGGDFKEIPTYEQVDQQIGATLRANGPVVLLTSTIVSPSTKQIIADFISRTPNSRHVQYDAVSCSGLLAAYGGSIPAHNFDRADVVVSLGADFLGSWLSSEEFAKGWAAKRKINESLAKPVMSKHYQFESFMSITGANADERFTHRPSETGTVALALLAAVSGGAAPTLPAPLAQGIAKVKASLQGAIGRALVVCDSNDVNVQTVVREINRAIGAIGTTIDTGSTLNFRQGDDAAMAQLVADMNAGGVGSLLIYGANPVYDYLDGTAFKNGLAKVRLSVSFGDKMDETTMLCQYALPSPHYLESWGDAEPRTGVISFIQPTIFPLFKTRPFETSLLKWSGNNTDYETYFRTYWISRLGGQVAFDKALQDGVLIAGGTAPVVASTTAADSTRQVTPLPTAPLTPSTTSPTAAVNIDAARAAITAAPPETGDEVVLYQKVSVGSGRQSGNPWLLELPDPVTKATWDNYAMISTEKARLLKIPFEGMDYEYYMDKPTIDITANGKTVRLPVLVIPGMNANTIAVAVGYGRNKEFNPALFDEHTEGGVGKNVYPFSRLVPATRTREYWSKATTSAETIDKAKVARIQVHNSYEGRTEVVKETTLATFAARPEDFRNFRKDLQEDYGADGYGDADGKKERNYRANGTLYGNPEDRRHEIKWGMNIDLNVCTGCSACVVACHLENNVPVVGKNEVLRAHEMHWLRIDRYFVTDQANPDNVKAVVFQPMLCQHCDNAPCENVCPVAATMHNSEGINQMAYNRCIGTRYCANNCPYKVRRFNWSDYTGASTHGRLGPGGGVGHLNGVVHQMNDELTRMVLNPDVTTRSRGVMEKCTFCVQRTQQGKLQAKMENRKLKGDEVQAACSQACTTGAITFGNVHDTESTVAKTRKENDKRLFYVIEQVHTLPNVSYLAKIRNTDELITASHNANEHANQEHSQPATPQHEPATH